MKYILFCIFFLIAISIKAQDTNPERALVFGAISGLSFHRAISTIVATGQQGDFQNRVGYFFGPYGRFPINQKNTIEFQVQLLYKTYNTKFRQPSDGDIHLRYAYLTIPSYFHFNWVGDVFSFFAGLELQYLVSQKNISMSSINVKAHTELSVSIHFGVQFYIQRLNVNIHYHRGFLGTSFSGMNISVGYRLLKFRNNSS